MHSVTRPFFAGPARVALGFALGLTLSTALAQQKPAAAPQPQPVRGPFWSGTVMLSKDKAAAMKGLAITLGADKRSYVVYDLDTLRLAAAWTGEFLEFGNTLTKIE